MTIPAEFSGERLAVLCAHPGHELRLFRWLEVAQPLVGLITDGSGGAAVSRVHYSESLVARTNARQARVFGGFPDREVYRWMAERDLAAIDRLVDVIAEDLVSERIDTVACDGYEGYNSTHDLTHALAIAAARRAGGNIRIYQFPLVGRFEPVTGSVATSLTPDDFARKMAAADSYAPLRQEVHAALERDGAEEYRHEVLTPVEGVDLDAFAHERPYYEVYGEQQVAAGRYREVIRYEEHLLPLFEHLGVAMPAVI